MAGLCDCVGARAYEPVPSDDAGPGSASGPSASRLRCGKVCSCPITSKVMQGAGTLLLMLAICAGFLVLCREYLSLILVWISGLSGVSGPIFLVLLYIVVSLPMTWGYIVLNIGSGYLYGVFVGVVVTSIGSNIGALISFIVCRLLWKDYVTKKISGFENLQQIVAVIEGRHGFRLIMMTRLTPLPFGLQNAMLSVCKLFTE
jgi:uncharacterized membrane protein YdjX (TVP38/TMEM64 family)